ncbi:hypothetical protein LTR02_006290 [Friedmanniomyces endolithicus]|uniref:Uncharacterized protein n=1 Tax=Rachicladosporium monterosium TaxID=1507873 RepID=A0ABR0LBD9_9PEZI|nr:hypothetical protein LTR94_001899 [Friedmanniomyces endolithicus]KAK5146351.1 hypothetical protein LTR32_002044 [Rachicladosporium monterosium]KAK0783310.1 hypothetical protein LTR59_011818 [Friedmanniomyces endolithicus]KAK0802864.1 hypothetical protein LTR38_006305 [Friedmanniomyces endolithicus]KAK0848435.1 hypothetical protein LTR03_005707 [Friedmanniomyces endolithicus]
MHSPLPDSSVLEAGIIEDDRPSRLSRVQDNVRHLLRASIPTSFRSSVIAAPPAHRATVEDADRTPLQSPLRRHVRIDVGVLPSPSSATTSESTFADEGANVPGVLFPPTSYQQQAEHVNHQSTMFNTRAIAALTHPDLTDPSMAIFLQQKTQERQNRAWKRSKNRKLRYASSKRSMVSWLLCLVTALILAAVVAIYLAIATSRNVSTTFHVLFILGILMATILFAHTVVRLCLFRTVIPDSPRLYIVPNGRLKRRRRHRHRDLPEQNQQHPRGMPQLQDATVDYAVMADYVPPTPIPVHVAADEVRPDSREAEPSASADRASTLAFDKDIDDLPKPPPAYGRWRGSVRVNPDLLHWQAIPSPTEPDTPALPSPTYEEAMATEQRSQPPSYVTRESPARRREMTDGRPGLARAQEVEPEMVEGRGIGLAS